MASPARALGFLGQLGTFGRNRGLQQAIPKGITTLEIRHSYFRDESAGLLLKHSRNLRRFVYYSRYRRDRDEVTFRELRRHLLPSRHTLEELDLHYGQTLLGGHEVCERMNQLRDGVPEFPAFPAFRVYDYWFPGGSSDTEEEESLGPWGQFQLPPGFGDSYPGSSEDE
ncbi:hypothetical protein PG988_007932 [Apiospora saccharicola]